MRVLTTESNNAIDHVIIWFSENKMNVHPDKFKSTVVQKIQLLNRLTHIMIENNKVDNWSSVKLLGIIIDNQNFSTNRSSHQRWSIKKGVLKNFAKFTGKTCATVSFLIKLQALSLQLFKKRLWHRCFPVNIAKFSRAPFFQNTSGQSLLKQHTSYNCKSSRQLKKTENFFKTLFLGFKAKEVLINTFILWSFSHCPLVWFISSAVNLMVISFNRE